LSDPETRILFLFVRGRPTQARCGAGRRCCSSAAAAAATAVSAAATAADAADAAVYSQFAD